MVCVAGIMCHTMLYSPWTRIIGKLLRKALLTTVKFDIPGNGFITEVCLSVRGMADVAKHDLYDEALGLTLDNIPSTETQTISDDNCLGIERNIKEEIRRLKQCKKRADSISVVKGLTTRLGLSGSVVSLKLNGMIASGKIVVASGKIVVNTHR